MASLNSSSVQALPSCHRPVATKKSSIVVDPLAPEAALTCIGEELESLYWGTVGADEELPLPVDVLGLDGG